MEQTALMIIDMQRDFVCEGGALRVAMAEATVPAIAAVLSHARRNNWMVCHIIRLHKPDGSDADRPRKHLFAHGGNGYCVIGSKGAEIVPELAPAKGEIIIAKTRNSAFFRTNLDRILRDNGVTDLIITGTQYPNCIRATANDAMSLDYRTIVVSDCCSAQTPEIAEANLLDMRNMGIEIISSSFL